MQIGEVAANAGVNIQTLRYYERRGLLPKARRRDSGYRDFNFARSTRGVRPRCEGKAPACPIIEALNDPGEHLIAAGPMEK